MVISAVEIGCFAWIIINRKKLKKWFNTKFPIIKPAGHPHTGLKARPCQVDHCAPQHVPVLGGKHQRQIGPDQVPLRFGNCKNIMKVILNIKYWKYWASTWCRRLAISSRQCGIRAGLESRWPSQCRASLLRWWSEARHFFHFDTIIAKW